MEKRIHAFRRSFEKNVCGEAVREGKMAGETLRYWVSLSPAYGPTFTSTLRVKSRECL